MTRAYKHRFAHLSSVRRMDSMSSWRSYSGLVVSQSSGARRGERRMKAPASQNRGNTGAKAAVCQYSCDPIDKIKDETHGIRT